jgi:hypothetical protein
MFYSFLFSILQVEVKRCDSFQMRVRVPLLRLLSAAASFLLTLLVHLHSPSLLLQLLHAPHLCLLLPLQQAAPAPKAMDSVDTADSFDISKDKHKGQYALRKLYHEGTRPITVLYTSPTCGPCRCGCQLGRVGVCAAHTHALTNTPPSTRVCKSLRMYSARNAVSECLGAVWFVVLAVRCSGTVTGGRPSKSDVPCYVMTLMCPCSCFLFDVLLLV